MSWCTIESDPGMALDQSIWATFSCSLAVVNFEEFSWDANGKIG